MTPRQLRYALKKNRIKMRKFQASGRPADAARVEAHSGDLVGTLAAD